MSDVSRETLEEEAPAFVLTMPAGRIELSDLPQSPAKTFRAATALGWDVRAWLATGEAPATLYRWGSLESDKNQHLAGDVRYPPYTAYIFTVEARDPETRAVGFQARYIGKVWPEEYGKRPTRGAFEAAVVADPVGLPRLLHPNYPVIPVSRGAQETESSFRLNSGRAKNTAARMDRDYNHPHYYHWPKIAWLFSGAEFDTWLADWASFTPKGTTDA